MKYRIAKKITFLTLVFILCALTTNVVAFVHDGNTLPCANLSSGEINNVRSYLSTQYNNSTSNGALSAHMGYQIALKAISYAGTPYGTMDCSNLTRTSVRNAYSAEGLLSGCIFTSTSNSAQQYSILNQNGLIINNNVDGHTDIVRDNAQTGDLLFWENPATGAINHVGIFVKYNSNAYIIESSRSAEKVVVSNRVWTSSEYKLCAYGRINTVKTATFKTSPFNVTIGTSKVLYNCPPTLPTLPTYSGYTFLYWTPSTTAGMTSNKTYTAVYTNAQVNRTGGCNKR